MSLSGAPLSAISDKPTFASRLLKWKFFLKAQVASFAATISDFSTMVLLVQVFHVHYTIGVAVGASMGAITNFLINRYWSFEATHSPIQAQAWRYFIVTVGSLGLNVLGVYLVTEYLGVKYYISKAVVALIIGFIYNYPLHRFFVYRAPKGEII